MGWDYEKVCMSNVETHKLTFERIQETSIDTL